MTKTFRAIEPLHDQLTTLSWQIHPPAAGTRDVLRVTFPHPLDWATLHRLLRVTGALGAISGLVSVERGEQAWRFVPAQPWSPGPHALRVNTAIEDHAGNSLARPFEVNLQQRPTSRTMQSVESEAALPFAVR